MKSVTIIDSGLVIYAASTMLSGGEPPLMPTTRQEIIRRFARLCYGMVKLAGNDSAIIAHDVGPYYRSKQYLDWYKANAEHTVVGDTDYLKFDNSIRPVYEDADGVQCGKPLTKPERKALEATDLLWFSVPEKLVPALPTYKQGRDKAKMMSRLGITAEEWLSIRDEAIEKVSAWLGISIVARKGWEADDVVGVYCKQAKKEVTKITMVTRDSDWRQLVLNAKRTVELQDVCTGRLWTLGEDKLEIIAGLRGKVVGGDAGDHISGLPKGDNGCWGKDGVNSDKFNGDVFNALKTLPEYRRNVDLIFLPCPVWNLEKSYEQMVKSVRKPAKGTMADVFVTQVDLDEMDDSTKIKALVRRLTGDKESLL